MSLQVCQYWSQRVRPKSYSRVGDGSLGGGSVDGGSEGKEGGSGSELHFDFWLYLLGWLEVE